MDLLRANEHALRGTAATTSFLDRVIDTFFTCIDRGIATRGELPGGLNVKRRAPDIHHQLTVERGQRRVAPQGARLGQCLCNRCERRECSGWAGGHRANQRAQRA